MNKIRKSEVELEKAQQKYHELLYSLTGKLLVDDYGLSEWQVDKLLKDSDKVWEECYDKSVFQTLEDESGIEFSLDGVGSYHDVKHLDGASWNGKELTVPNYIYMRQEQRKWVPSLIIASICLTLYRGFGWDYHRINMFVEDLNYIWSEIGKEN